MTSHRPIPPPEALRVSHKAHGLVWLIGVSTVCARLWDGLATVLDGHHNSWAYGALSMVAVFGESVDSQPLAKNENLFWHFSATVTTKECSLGLHLSPIGPFHRPWAMAPPEHEGIMASIINGLADPRPLPTPLSTVQHNMWWWSEAPPGKWPPTPRKLARKNVWCLPSLAIAISISHTVGKTIFAGEKTIGTDANQERGQPFLNTLVDGWPCSQDWQGFIRASPQPSTTIVRHY